MNCEKCGREGAAFMGNSKSWGPDPCDCENTSENLPGGFAWLCDECISTVWLEIQEGGK